MDQDGFLFTDEVADLAGLTPRSVTFYASQTRRKIKAGTATDADMPLPVDSVRRIVTVKGGTRTIVSPRWRRDRIEAWMSRRKGPGGRYTSVVPDHLTVPCETCGAGVAQRCRTMDGCSPGSPTDTHKARLDALALVGAR